MGDETRPLAELPPADRTLLVRPPLELAVVEVRFVSDSSDAVDSTVAMALKQALAATGVEYPRTERAQENRVAIQMDPAAGAPQTQVTQSGRGWQLHAADGSSTVTVLPSAVVLQTTRYERWSVTLRPALLAMLEVVAEHLKPQLLERIGLRYVDRFVEVGATAASWQGRIAEQLLGAVAHPVFGALVRSAQQQVDIALGPAQGAMLRHGPFVDPNVGGSVSYMVDIDVFDAESTAFEPEQLTIRAEVLNRTAATLFQQTLTREFLVSLQGDAAGAPGEEGTS